MNTEITRELLVYIIENNLNLFIEILKENYGIDFYNDD